MHAHPGDSSSNRHGVQGLLPVCVIRSLLQVNYQFIDAAAPSSAPQFGLWQLTDACCILAVMANIVCVVNKCVFVDCM